MQLMKKIVRKISTTVERRPLVSFFSLLGLLLVLIIAGNFLRQPKAEPTAVAQPAKAVDVFGIGVSPRVQVSAKIDKSGVVTLVAQTPGIIQAINKLEGDQVYSGEWIFSLSTNYQGGNIQSLSRQIAQKNLDFVEDNYETQKQMISKRRDIANSADTQSDELRDISSKSIDETKSLITLNEQVLNYYDDQINTLESGGATDAVLNPIREGKSRTLQGLSSLRSALRNSEYQTSGDQEPARISNISRELTNQQLDIEEKGLALNREISKLNLRIAQVSEALMYPSSPVAGTVERIHVRIGDAVNPGTKLATITGSKLSAKAVALVSSSMASSLSGLEKSRLRAGDRVLELSPQYVSTEPTDGQLHSVTYMIPEEYTDEFKNGSYVTVEIPVSKPMSLSSIIFVPLDSVYQTQTDSYVFVASPQKGGKYKAESRNITLGNVVGSYVEVRKGLKEEDQVITNRDVVSGDLVSIK
jgi:multidrug efflux pump subunit AcrA (membrane-fusion protein)